MAGAKKKSVKSPVKKTVKKVKMPPITASYRRADTYAFISESVEITKKQVAAVFDSLGMVIEGHLKKGHAFILPGYFKCQLIRKPATKARKGINPFNGEPTVFKAKPARNVVKLRPLKKIKDMV